MKEKNQVKRTRLAPEARRKQIIEAARMVFCESGYSGTSVADIAKRAKITEPYFYRHFKSRDELFQLAIVDPLDGIMKHVASEVHDLVVRSDIDPPTALQRLHELMLIHVVEMVPLVTATLFSDRDEGPQIYSELIIPRMRENVRSVLAKFTGWNANSKGVDLAAQALMGVHLGIAQEALLSKHKLNISEVARQLSLMFSRSLNEPKLDGRRKSLADVSLSVNQKTKRLPPKADPNHKSMSVGTPSTKNTQTGKKQRLPEAERRLAICAAAQEVFLRCGLRGARSKAIANQAGITEAFMFKHFASKVELYQEAVEIPLAAAFAELAEQVSYLGKTASGVKFIEKLNQLCLPFFIKNGPLCSVALYSELSEGQKYYRRILSPHLKTIADTIITRAGWIDRHIDPDIARRAITGAQWAIGFDYKLRHRTQEIEEIALNLTRLFTGGIRWA